MEGHAIQQLDYLLRTVNVMNDKERLRNCSRVRRKKREYHDNSYQE